MEIKKSDVKKWSGTYKGVGFEINNRNQDWTYYLILEIGKIPEEHEPKSYWLRGGKHRNYVMYDYYKHPVLPNLDWHGITWYSKERGFDGDKKIVKVGCDYQHIWDEGKHYNLDIVKRDVQQTIEIFLEYVPNYKSRCCGNGNLYNLSEGVVRNGSFYSREYFGNKDWFKSAMINKTQLKTK